MISKKAIDLIKEFENDPNDYLGKPEWPGSKSGITIGFGWDLGYTDWTETAKAWKALNANDLSALLAVSGYKGEQAKARLSEVVHIKIPFTIAESVFFNETIPTWEARTEKVYPQARQLPEDCFGALVSLVFNRGPSVSDDDRRKEMRQIQAELAANNPSAVPGLIKSMKRLWPDVAGLRRRRDAEAALFEYGLSLRGE